MKRFAGVLLLAVLGPTLVSSAEKEKTLGEPRQDAALVYLYRKSAMAGGARALHVFYDDRLVAVLRNNTYTFAYIEPGTHLFWDDGRERGLCDFAAGQTYYLSFHLVDGMSILSVSDGKTAIENRRSTFAEGHPLFGLPRMSPTSAGHLVSSGTRRASVLGL